MSRDLIEKIRTQFEEGCCNVLICIVKFIIHHDTKRGKQNKSYSLSTNEVIFHDHVYLSKSTYACAFGTRAGVPQLI